MNWPLVRGNAGIAARRQVRILEHRAAARLVERRPFLAPPVQRFGLLFEQRRIVLVQLDRRAQHDDVAEIAATIGEPRLSRGDQVIVSLARRRCAPIAPRHATRRRGSRRSSRCRRRRCPARRPSCGSRPTPPPPCAWRRAAPAARRRAPIRRRAGSIWSSPLPIRITSASSPSSGKRRFEPRPSANHGTPSRRAAAERRRRRLRRWPGRARSPGRRCDRSTSAPAALVLAHLAAHLAARSAAANAGVARASAHVTRVGRLARQRVPLLQRAHLEPPALQRDDRVARRRRPPTSSWCTARRAAARRGAWRSRPAGSACRAAC